MSRTILAVDPGRDKCGLALVSGEGVQFRAIVPAAEIGLTVHYLLQQHPDCEAIIGQGTGMDQVLRDISQHHPDVAVRPVPERDSTLRARGRYFQDQPTPWWQRLLPKGMRLPPRAVDDYAAVVMAEDALRA